MWLRWILIEAAQIAKRHPDFAETYRAMARRRGKKIATIAVTRKLLARGYHLLIQAEQTPDQQTIAPRRRSPAPAPTRHTTTGRVTSPGRARVSA